MKKNMGYADRLIRMTIVFIIAALLFTGKVTGGWATILGVVGVVFALTSLVGSCPLYSVLGISTCPTKSK